MWIIIKINNFFFWWPGTWASLCSCSTPPWALAVSPFNRHASNCSPCAWSHSPTCCRWSLHWGSYHPSSHWWWCPSSALVPSVVHCANINSVFSIIKQSGSRTPSCASWSTPSAAHPPIHSCDGCWSGHWRPGACGGSERSPPVLLKMLNAADNRLPPPPLPRHVASCVTLPALTYRLQALLRVFSLFFALKFEKNKLSGDINYNSHHRFQFRPNYWEKWKNE